MFNIGPMELLVILVIALLVVGPQRLPEVGRSVGRALREFRRAQDEVQRTLRMSLDDDEPPSRPMRGVRSTGADPEPDGAAPAPDPASAAESETGRGDVEDVAKALGRGLAELRRAKEELQSTFRVDLRDDGDDGSSAPRAG
jgi:TatA/E family protein of Tat protein translocase